MTKNHQAALDKARTSALALKKQADAARSLGLTVLEQWLREASVGCQVGADFQERAMDDNLFTQTEKLVADGKSNSKEADAIADAMKRKGLV